MASGKKKAKVFFTTWKWDESKQKDMEINVVSDWNSGKKQKIRNKKRSRKRGGEPGCLIITCNCSHSYQDTLYGKNKRVANPAEGKGAHKGRYKCTSCQKFNK